MFLSGPVRGSVVALCIVVLAVAGCRTHRERDEKKQTPDVLYKRARHNLDSNDFNAAIKTYEQLTARFPFADEARQSRLDLIYAYYRAGEGESATDAAETFIRENPTHPRVDYAWYVKGLKWELRAHAEHDRASVPRRLHAAPAQHGAQGVHRLQDRGRAVPQERVRARLAAAHDLSRATASRATRCTSRATTSSAARTSPPPSAPRGRSSSTTGVPAVREALQIMIQSYDRLNLQPLAAQTRQVYEANYGGDVRQSQAEIKKAWWRIW